MHPVGIVYILRCKNNRYYIGSTNDLERRLSEHSRGFVAATKYLLPITLVFSEYFPSLITARQIEYRLKRMKNRKLIEKIITDGHIKLSDDFDNSVGG